jgi:hypothetical protein
MIIMYLRHDTHNLAVSLLTAGVRVQVQDDPCRIYRDDVAVGHPFGSALSIIILYTYFFVCRPLCVV